MYKKFESSWSMVIFSATALFSVIVIGLFGRGANDPQGLLFALGCFMVVILLLVVHRFRTYVVVLEDKFIFNYGHRTFGHDKVDIKSVKYIARIKAFSWKTWGSLLIIYYLEDGQLRSTFIKEDNYSESSLQNLLKAIKEINPAIELDAQYSAFLKREPSFNDFKVTPADRAAPEVEDEMKRRFSLPNS